jgi:hypothetical protein
LRDEQVKISIARFKERIQPQPVRDDKIAIVCFGPSLNETWEKIRDFKYIISCSGAHKFLMSRGIVPTWHMEVDPRAHKVELIGDKIDPSTTFLLASCCHPDVFSHVEKLGGKIVLWHTYSGESQDTLPTIYPRGEWVVTGGANVGLRAFTIARFLGFRDLHIFGMDGSFPPGEGQLKHAEHHPNAKQKYVLTEYNGKEFATTHAFLQCARMTFHELEMLPDVSATFYGEGLIQEMSKNKLLKKKDKAGIAFFSSAVISAEYAAQNCLLHRTNAFYGVSAEKHVDTVKSLFKAVGANSLLDYGCGKGLLAKHLDFPIWEYDPAIPGKDAPARPADLVVCIDVLEHVEPEYLDAVLADLYRCIKKVGYLIICTNASMKTLPDGRNTHLIQQNKDWWEKRLTKYFSIPDGGIIQAKGNELHVVVSKSDIKNNNLNKMMVSAEKELVCQ